MTEFIGAIRVNNFNKGIFVTTSSFQKNAKASALSASQSIILLDGEAIAELMYKHNLGVKVSTVKEVDHDFFEEYMLDTQDEDNHE